MELEVRAYTPDDLPAMIRIWNEVVEDGVAFPQEELLDEITGAEFSPRRRIMRSPSRKRADR